MAKQTWIPHKLCSVGEDKPCLRSNVATKLDEKCEWGLSSPSRLVMSMSRSRCHIVEKVRL